MQSLMFTKYDLLLNEQNMTSNLSIKTSVIASRYRLAFWIISNKNNNSTPAFLAAKQQKKKNKENQKYETHNSLLRVSFNLAG